MQPSCTDPFRAAPLIKEIGRGPHGARGISRADAQALYTAMLDGRVSDLELGAIVMALRIKGESVDELAGFLDAAEASFEYLQAPDGHYAPVVLPSYNGARNMPNLTPLLALLLARDGVPVFLHGVLHDEKRVTSAEILQQLGIPLSPHGQHAQRQMADGLPAFMAIDVLAPRMHRLLALRDVLGVRNSTHTLVKILQPFAGAALRLTSYTHAEYLELLTAYFMHAAPAARGDMFLMRGTEGETVANAKRAHAIEWFHDGQRTTLREREAPADDLPPLPAARDAATTAAWIRDALAGRQPVPAPILEQAGHCRHVARQIRLREQTATQAAP